MEWVQASDSMRPVVLVGAATVEISEEKLHIGPSDYVPHLGDQKVAFIQLRAEGWNGAPIRVDLRLEGCGLSQLGGCRGGGDPRVKAGDRPQGDWCH